MSKKSSKTRSDTTITISQSKSNKIKKPETKNEISSSGDESIECIYISNDESEEIKPAIKSKMPLKRSQRIKETLNKTNALHETTNLNKRKITNTDNDTHGVNKNETTKKLRLLEKLRDQPTSSSGSITNSSRSSSKTRSSQEKKSSDKENVNSRVPNSLAKNVEESMKYQALNPIGYNQTPVSCLKDENNDNNNNHQSIQFELNQIEMIINIPKH
jgi:hypothetical protein